MVDGPSCHVLYRGCVPGVFGQDVHTGFVIITASVLVRELFDDFGISDVLICMIDPDVGLTCYTTQNQSYFVSKAAALQLSTPTLHLNKHTALLQGLICASPVG